MVNIPITIRDGLPFIIAAVSVGNETALFSHVLVDTGSAMSLFDVNTLALFKIELDGSEILSEMFGIGGGETVVRKWVDNVRVGGLETGIARVQVGNMNYGIEIDGILGFDLLSTLGVTLDLVQMAIVKS